MIFSRCLLGCGVLLAIMSLVGCREGEPTAEPYRERTAAEKLGTYFAEPSARWKAMPEFTQIELPDPPLKNSVWGATGRDDAGNIYLGISCDGPGVTSAVLCLLRPGSQQAVSLGDAVTNLQRLKLMAEENASQMKIHAKPVQANDGMLYFASMDERGERGDGSRLAVHGSHLWRIPQQAEADNDAEPPEWEHLLAVPESLIATGCTGRYVYALGYFQHVVYQYDTQTGKVRRTQVGSVGGHISRNFLVDRNEHVYVPRVVEDDAGELVVFLVELDTELKEVTTHRLEDYGPGKNADSHGIVGFAAMQSGDFYFVTAEGALYHLAPQTDGPSQCERRGWIHPEGNSYTSFLCSPAGTHTLCGITKRRGTKFQWLVYDIDMETSEVFDFSGIASELLERKNVLVYGSNTQDDQGDAFAVGWFLEQQSGGFRPWAARVNWPQLAEASLPATQEAESQESSATD